MAVKARVQGGAVVEYPLSFNDIIGHTPGREGRDDAKVGAFQHRNGKILVVYSKNPQLVKIDPRRNNRKTNRTGMTRTGMAMIDTDGKVRLVTCDTKPDGDKNWRTFTGTVTLTA